MLKFEKAAEVVTSDGQNLGRLESISDDHFLVYKKGFLSDEQFRIPTSAISEEKSSTRLIRLEMSEEQIKHGREFLQGRPNSELVHGKSEHNILPEKQIIRYQPAHEDQSSVQDTNASPPAQIVSIALDHPLPSHYSCDMCSAKFKYAESLNKHRLAAHKGPGNI